MMWNEIKRPKVDHSKDSFYIIEACLKTYFVSYSFFKEIIGCYGWKQIEFSYCYFYYEDVENIIKKLSINKIITRICFKNWKCYKLQVQKEYTLQFSIENWTHQIFIIN